MVSGCYCSRALIRMDQVSSARRACHELELCRLLLYVYSFDFNQFALCLSFAFC